MVADFIRENRVIKFVPKWGETMNAEMKNKLENCFSRKSSPADCYGALPYMKENLGRINFEDDSDLHDLTDIILRALKLDENNIKFVEFLISNGYDINYKLTGNDCLLLKYVDDALKNRILPLEGIKQLIRLGADACSETLDGDNLLSILAGREEMAAVYVVEFCDLKLLDKTDKYGATPLMYAAMRGYNTLARILIERGFDVNAVGSAPVTDEKLQVETDGVSPLALAIRFGNAEMVRMLLAAGADETVYDAEGNPPIFSLIRYPVDFFREFYGNCIKDDHPIYAQKMEIISLLTQLDLTNAEGYTVLMKSLFPMKFWYTGFGNGISPKKNRLIALALIKKGADVNAAGNDSRRPLHQAVVDLEEVARALVEAGADINVQDNEGNTPLMYACMKAKEETVLWLLKAGADYKLQNNEGKTAVDMAAKRGYSRALELMEANTLLQACRNNQKRSVQVILNRGGIDINERDEECGTPLMYACQNNALEIVKMLLDNGADPNIGNQKNLTPLHFSAALGAVPIINLLVKAGADVNSTDNNGTTPLMYMAMKAKTAAALNYIKNPIVDVNIKSNVGWTAVMYAIAFKQPQLAKALLPLMGTGTDDADDADVEGLTMLHYACQYGPVEIVKLVIERNPGSVNRTSNVGDTPLMMAARTSNLVIVKQLLAAGADAGCSNGKGVTALHLAAILGNVPLGKALLDAGADIDAKTREGQTPLMYAVIKGKSEFAQMLVLENADLNAVDNMQGNALSYAIQAQLPQTVELLLEAGAER